MKHSERKSGLPERGERGERGERAGRAREWSGEQLRERPVPVGLGALALGFVSASLFPPTRTEERAWARVAERTHEVADRFAASRRLEEVLYNARHIALTVATEQLLSRALKVARNGAHSRRP